MKTIIALIIAALFVIALLIYAVIVLIQQFKSDLKAGKLAATTAFVILFSLVGTYSIALFFKEVPIIEQVGSADAWIGFAGAGMSGIITMLVLYFTLKPSIKANELSEKIIKTDLERYKLEMRPFVFVSNWEAFEITPQELVDDPTKKYIQIGEHKTGNALGIALELTNTTHSCVSVSYSGAVSQSTNQKWTNAATNQGNLKMTLASGEKDSFVFYASPTFIQSQMHQKITIELILENRFAQRYKETFVLIITSMSNQVYKTPGKWYSHLFAQEYKIGKFLKNENGEIICVDEEL